MDSLDHSSTELPPQDDLQQILRGPSPCDACRSAARCATSFEACEAFGLYVNGRSDVRWRTAPRVPTKGQGRRSASRGSARRYCGRSRKGRGDPFETLEQRRERWRLAARIRRANAQRGFRARSPAGAEERAGRPTFLSRSDIPTRCVVLLLRPRCGTHWYGASSHRAPFASEPVRRVGRR